MYIDCTFSNQNQVNRKQNLYSVYGHSPVSLHKIIKNKIKNNEMGNDQAKKTARNLPLWDDKFA